MSTMPKESKESVQSEKTSPTVAEVSPPHSSKQLAETSIPNDSTHITIDSESMQVDNTNVAMDRDEDPFKYFGSSIVGNIVDYSSSFDEEEKKEQKKEDVFYENKFETMSNSTKAATTSVPLEKTIVKPSTPPT